MEKELGKKVQEEDLGGGKNTTIFFDGRKDKRSSEKKRGQAEPSKEIRSTQL